MTTLPIEDQAVEHPYDYELESVMDSEATCLMIDGLATHVIRHGVCTQMACASHAEMTEATKRLSIEDGSPMRCPVCPGSKFDPRDLHINPA